MNKNYIYDRILHTALLLTTDHWDSLHTPGRDLRGCRMQDVWDREVLRQHSQQGNFFQKRAMSHSHWTPTVLRYTYLLRGVCGLCTFPSLISHQAYAENILKIGREYLTDWGVVWTPFTISNGLETLLSVGIKIRTPSGSGTGQGGDGCFWPSCKGSSGRNGTI